MQIQPACPCHSITCKRNRDKWDVAKLVTEFIGLGFLVVYTIFTGLMYHANKQAADAATSAAQSADQSLQFTKKLINATQAAYFKCQQPELRQQTNPWIIVTCINSGPIAARAINGQAVFTRTDAKGIVHRQLRSIKRSVVGQNDGFYEILPLGIPFDLTEYAKQTMIIKMNFTYNNGIEEQAENWCRELVVEQGNSYGWEQCESAKARKQYPPG